MNLLFILIAVIVVWLGCGWLEAKVYLSQPQALQTAFQSNAVERKTLFLTPGQVQQVETLSRTKVDSSIVSYYVSRDAKGITEFAFFDKRTVRTMPVTYMAVLNPSGTIDRVDILSFEEPDDYLPPARWLALYKNRSLNNDLVIGRDIPHITGASLSSQAMNDGIRQILAIYQLCIKTTI